MTKVVSNQEALAKGRREYELDVSERATARLENWREVCTYQQQKQTQVFCDPSDGFWYHYEIADVGQKEKIIVHFPAGMITAIYNTRSRTGRSASSVPPELAADQLAVFDEDSVRNTLRPTFKFDKEEQKMFDKLVNEASLKIVPKPQALRQKLRKADKEQRERTQHIDYLNLTVQPKVEQEAPAADFWKTIKKARPKPMRKKKVETESESSESEPSSDEELPDSDIILEDNRHCSSSLVIREEQKIEKVTTALEQFKYPKCAELLLHMLDERPTMTVEELVAVEPDIWRTNALTGQAQQL